MCFKVGTMTEFSTDAQKAHLLLPVLAAAGVTRTGARGARYWHWGGHAQEDDLLPLCLDLGHQLAADGMKVGAAAPPLVVATSPSKEPELWERMRETQYLNEKAEAYRRAACRASDYLQSYDGALAVIRWAAALLDRDQKGQGAA